MAKPKPKGDGPALDFELPQITEEDWSEFEGIIDSPLNNEERLEITEAAEHCVVGRFFADEDRKRIAMRGRLHDGKVKRSTSALAFLKTMDRLVETWRKVQIDPDARKAIEDYSDEPAFDLLHAMEDLQFHRVALRLFLMREPGNPFVPFVGRLAAVYEKSTNTPVTVALPKDGRDWGAYMSPFVEFVMEVDGRLPTIARRAGKETPGAWSQAVRRALQEYNKAG